MSIDQARSYFPGAQQFSIRLLLSRSRLILGLIFLCAFGCKEETRRAEEGIRRSRRGAVVQKRHGQALTERGLDALCERRFKANDSSAPTWKTPPLRPLPDEERVQPLPQGGWRWVNLWATWCKPCVEEFAMMRRWLKALRAEGVAPELILLSIDAQSQAGTLKAMSPKLPHSQSWWLQRPEVLGSILEGFGLRAGAPIPIHAIIDPSDQLRCLRVGKLSPLDLPALKALLRSR
ncbi:MAG: hypothetical protein VYD19_03010 [Myxococcota bacterium]|nr:hypothetical protein [Myxococcota bacterium]